MESIVWRNDLFISSQNLTCALSMFPSAKLTASIIRLFNFNYQRMLHYFIFKRVTLNINLLLIFCDAKPVETCDRINPEFMQYWIHEIPSDYAHTVKRDFLTNTHTSLEWPNTNTPAHIHNPQINVCGLKVYQKLKHKRIGQFPSNFDVSYGNIFFLFQRNHVFVTL